MNQTNKTLLIQKYDAFELEENPHLKKHRRIEIFNLLQNEEEPDANALYIWGLTYYFSDDDKAYDTRMALEKFLQAYHLDKNHFLACLYTAHCYQDQNELTEALKYYELVNQDALKEFQIWRYVKLIQQIGYCHYQLDNQVLGRKHFQEVLEWYNKLPAEDRPVPSELLKCLLADNEIVIEIKQIEDYLD